MATPPQATSTAPAGARTTTTSASLTALCSFRPGRSSMRAPASGFADQRGGRPRCSRALSLGRRPRRTLFALRPNPGVPAWSRGARGPGGSADVVVGALALEGLLALVDVAVDGAQLDQRRHLGQGLA